MQIMKDKLILILLLGVSNFLSAQTTIRYINELSFISPEVPKEEALYSRTSTKNYGDITFEDFDLKNNKLISKKTYRAGDPYGKWEIYNGSKLVELDYNFNSTYMKSTDELCNDSIFFDKIDNAVFKDNKNQNYLAPRLKYDLDINQFIKNELIYPPDALKYNFNGHVYLQFEISIEGKVQNVKIIKGKEKHLDKEAERVIRKLEFISPAYLNGKPINLCLSIPIKFTLIDN